MRRSLGRPVRDIRPLGATVYERSLFPARDRRAARGAQSPSPLTEMRHFPNGYSKQQELLIRAKV